MANCPDACQAQIDTLAGELAALRATVSSLSQSAAVPYPFGPQPFILNAGRKATTRLFDIPAKQVAVIQVTAFYEGGQHTLLRSMVGVTLRAASSASVIVPELARQNIGQPATPCEFLIGFSGTTVTVMLGD